MFKLCTTDRGTDIKGVTAKKSAAGKIDHTGSLSGPLTEHDL